jgi:EAL domain-containing protein (putative c-di-GMP-specific phosphodiesterase class I)
MNTPKELPNLQFDEVGLATARHGEYLLRSVFQLIFRRDGNLLRAAMVEGRLRPYLNGDPVPLESYASHAQKSAGAAYAFSCMTLHASNHHHCGVDDIVHLLSGHFTVGQGTVRDVEHLIAETGMDPSEIVFTLNLDGEHPEGISDRELAVASALKGLGVGLALRLPSGAKFDALALGAIKPDVLRLNAGGLSLVLQDAGARRLFSSHVDQMQRDGINVLMDGVDTPELFGLALSVNVKMMGGEALAPAQLAGTLPPPSEIILRKDGAPPVPLRVGQS